MLFFVLFFFCFLFLWTRCYIYFWRLLIAFSVTSRVCDYLVVGDGRFCHGLIARVVVYDS